MRQPTRYPMGSISSGTMRPEDLIPAFCTELESNAKGHGWTSFVHTAATSYHIGNVSARTRKAHLTLVREIEARMADADAMSPYWLDTAYSDLDALSTALEEYAGPYF